MAWDDGAAWWLMFQEPPPGMGWNFMRRTAATARRSEANRERRDNEAPDCVRCHWQLQVDLVRNQIFLNDHLPRYVSMR